MTVKNRINAYFYTAHQIKPCHKKDEVNVLYSRGRYRTKLTAKNLPDWYMFGSMYGGYGFISSKGVKHLLYIPEYSNADSVYCNDKLLISYDQPITPLTKENGAKWYCGYDCCLSGPEIVMFTDAVERYTGISTEDIRRELRKKAIWFIDQHQKDKIIL